jgi:hypothetical protein
MNLTDIVINPSIANSAIVGVCIDEKRHREVQRIASSVVWNKVVQIKGCASLNVRRSGDIAEAELHASP